ncbi:hypothetical protein CPER28S_01381 [Cellulomonas persica]
MRWPTLIFWPTRTYLPGFHGCTYAIQVGVPSITEWIVT